MGPMSKHRDGTLAAVWLTSKAFVVMGSMDRMGSHGSQGMTSMTCVRKKEESKKVSSTPSEASDPSGPCHQRHQTNPRHPSGCEGSPDRRARKERTEWHRVVIFNDRISEVAERFLRKGSKVYVEGSLQDRKWTDQSGEGRYSSRGDLDDDIPS